MHQTWTEIDLLALRRNFARFTERLSPKTRVILSVKKDAYGHGAIPVARAVAADPRLAAFGVATLPEARELREAGLETPILVFSVLRGEELKEAIARRVTLTITDAKDAAEAAETARAAGAKAEAHMKIDTGMGRLGRLPVETVGSLLSIVGMPGLQLKAIYTHLADGWDDPTGAVGQAHKLTSFAQEASKAGGQPIETHIGGSDALSVIEDFQWDAARSGIAVYGYHAGIPGLEPVMTFKSTIIYRRSAPTGTRISYGGTHILQKDSELALVGVGYGNGYLRSLSNKGRVLIGGARCALLGRVCMDQIVVDVTDAPKCRPGDEVVLFGRQGEATLGADEVAHWGGTIPYELLCMAGMANPRVYPEPRD